MKVKKNVSTTKTTTTVEGFTVREGETEPSKVSYTINGNYPDAVKAMMKVRKIDPMFTIAHEPTINHTKAYVPIDVFNAIAVSETDIATTEEYNGWVSYISKAIEALQNMVKDYE